MGDQHGTVHMRAKLLGYGISGGIYSAICCGAPLLFVGTGVSETAFGVVYSGFLYCTPLLFLWLGKVLAGRFAAREGRHRRAP